MFSIKEEKKSNVIKIALIVAGIIVVTVGVILLVKYLKRRAQEKRELEEALEAEIDAMIDENGAQIAQETRGV